MSDRRLQMEYIVKFQSDHCGIEMLLSEALLLLENVGFNRTIVELK